MSYHLPFVDPVSLKRLALASKRCLLRISLLLLLVESGPCWLGAATPERIWEKGPQARSAKVQPKIPPESTTRLSRLSPEQTGVAFTNLLSLDRYTTNQIYLNGSGVAAGDVDGDGWCDLYFCGLDGPNVLYRNLGNWKFEDITSGSGVACPESDATGVAFADLDGDGDLDLVVNTVGSGTRIFFNDGKAHFTERTPLNPGKGGTSLAVADFDGDGALDLYICNYRTHTLRDQPKTSFRLKLVNGQRVISEVNGVPVSDPALEGRFSLGSGGRILEHGEVDVLYHNNGKGEFTPVPFTGGSFLDEEGRPLIEAPHDWGLSVTARDLNGDGSPDLYVCNDFDSPDRVWMNDGHGKFRALSKLAMRNSSRFSMGVDVADINRDGFDDLLVLDMLDKNRAFRLTRADRLAEPTPLGEFQNRPQLPRNTLQLNRGDGTYAEVAYQLGLAASGWSWTPAFLDVDLDGYEDLLITGGHGRDDMDLDTGMRLEATKKTARLTPLEELSLRRQTPKLAQPLQAFRNLGGARFEEVSDQWGFQAVGIHQGLCLADLDNDGDLDVVVNTLNGAAELYRNEATEGRVAVRLRGLGGNRQGVGARIRLMGGATEQQSQEVICGGRYLSSDEGTRVFASGTPTPDRRMRLEVIWRSGRRSVVEGVEANRLYEISEESAEAPPLAKPSPSSELFEDLSTTLDHRHHPSLFDDFAHQPLLPRRLSSVGPGLGWIDLDGDGREELVVAGSKGDRLGVFRWSEREGMARWTGWGKDQLLIRDVLGVVGTGRDGRVLLALGPPDETAATLPSSGVETVGQDGAVLQRLESSLAGFSGALALADIDGDGNLELFVGGGPVLDRYPESLPSQIFQRRSGEWVKDEVRSRVVQSAGLVNGAVWTDLNGDGFPELVLACEMGPIRLFLNQQGVLKEQTREWGLASMLGWWNGVTAGDFDGDGKMDLMASNWGLNSGWDATLDRPWRLYYGDLGAGRVDLIEATYDPSVREWIPERDLTAVGRVLPFIRERFPSNRSYAQAGVEKILGERLPEMKRMEVNHLETTVWLNRGDHFERGQLPAAAQFSPAFGLSVGDLDGDGYEDVLMGQNFFGVAPQASRSDAGRGLVLKGDGKGGFAELPASMSGLRVYGEQRGAALADFDGDGRWDWVVSQYGNQTRLFHNRGGRPGLRVRILGPVGNPSGFGCMLRLRTSQGWGPAREIHGGSGHFSQDGAIQIMPGSVSPLQLEVRWPGGRRSVLDLPPSALEVSIDSQGNLTRIR